MHFEVGERVYFADPKTNKLLAYDKPPLPGWVSIGCHSEECILVDEEEWESFVKLILEADQYIRTNNRLDDGTLKQILEIEKYISETHRDDATYPD